MLQEEILNCILCCLGLNVEGYRQVLSLYWKPPGEAAEQNWTDCPSLSTQVYHWWTLSESSFWLWEFDFRKKEEELWSYTFKMSFTDLPHRSSGFLWRKEYPAIHRKTMNIMLQFLTPHTFEQSFAYSTHTNSKLRSALISAEKEMCVWLPISCLTLNWYLWSKEQAQEVHIIFTLNK